MIVISVAQTDQLREQSIRAFIDGAVPWLRADHPELTRDCDDPALRTQLEVVTAFCLDATVMNSAHIRQIILAHLRRGITTPTAATSPQPLRRGGFTETERVAAYIEGLSSGARRRIRLCDLSRIKGE